MSDDNSKNTSTIPETSDVSRATEAPNDPSKTQAGPFAILFPPDLSVWGQARKLVGDGNARVDDLAACAGQDPVIVIELLKISNAMYFSAGRQPITATKTALVRLGSDTVLDTLEKMKDRPQFECKEVSQWFEVHRSRCRRTAIIARLIAEIQAKNLSDECQVTGSFMYVGEMLAVANFQERYVRLAEEMARSGVNYRLAQDLKFDVERMGLQYLRRNGIPEAILFAIDREGRSKSAERAIMKPLCMAAGELVDAFDTNRWDKFAPGKQLPPKSAVRMLPLNESQYLKIYERASEYLFSARVIDEKKRRGEEPQPAAVTATISIPQVTNNPDQATLQNEINSILSSGHEAAAVEEAAKAAQVPQTVKQSAPPTQVAATEVDASSESDDFSLTPTKEKPKSSRRKGESSKKVAPPKLVSSSGEAVVASIAGVLNSATNSEQLLSEILAMLVDNGPFKKSALIVVSRDRKKAIVVAARGPNIGNGQKLDLDDPLSPLAQCFSKVQSFGNKENKSSPWGSRSFAVAPIDADHETPVALYADCGNDGSLTFEARRVFRTVVDILNQKLPDIPGGIPIEL